MQAVKKFLVLFLAVSLVLAFNAPLLAFAKPAEVPDLAAEAESDIQDGVVEYDQVTLDEPDQESETEALSEEAETPVEMLQFSTAELGSNETTTLEAKAIVGDLEVSGGTQDVDYEFSSAGKILTIISDKELTISNSAGSTVSESQIVVIPGVNANITIKNLSIDFSDRSSLCALAVQPSSSLNLTISGSNFLKSAQNSAGLEVPEGASVVIASEDGSTAHSLECTSGSTDTASVAAGIGGSNRDGARDCGAVTINSGTIVAKSINGTGTGLPAGLGAGIGGSGHPDAQPNTSIYGGDGGTVVINGGVVAAWGGYYASGIGGGGGCRPSSTFPFTNAGTGGNGGSVTINGGTVDARSVQDAQGTASNYVGSIGSGFKGDPLKDRDQGSLAITGGSIFRAETFRTGYEAQAIKGAVNVYPVEFTFTDGVTPLSTATLVTAQSGLDGYGLNDVYTQKTTGKTCFYLPENNTPATVSATAGATYKSGTNKVVVKSEYPCKDNTYNLYKINHDSVNPPKPDTPISLDKDIKITVNGSLDSLVSITLGGIDIPLAPMVNGFRYLMWPGQTGRYCGEVHEDNGVLQITFYKDYLATLKNGTFTLKVSFEDTFNGDTVESTTEVKFTVRHPLLPNPDSDQDSDPGSDPDSDSDPDPDSGSNPIPGTGDTHNLAALAFFANIAFVVALGAGMYQRKRYHSYKAS